MARNRIQFQKGLSEARFVALYGSEERCRTALARWRWPDGFMCPKCGGREHCIVGPRKLYQCNACRRQTSLTAGTIFDSTKVALTTWFRAMDLITQTKQGISARSNWAAGSDVTQTTAWKIKTKLAEVMRIASEPSASTAGSRWMMPISAASALAARQGAAALARSRSSWRFKPLTMADPGASSCAASLASRESG